jgi:sigma-B regulation protein RsbQ
MWRYMIPDFEADYRIVLYDHIGTGHSDYSSFSKQRYPDLKAYARDLLEVIEQLDLRAVIFVGHSVSSIIGILAANKNPERFAHLVLVGPSPRYIDDPETGYYGGFQREDIEEMLESLETNYLGWSSQIAPAIMGNADRPELGEELVNHFSQQDPEVAYHFAKLTFESDNRADLAQVSVPTLILQCREDIIAPLPVGKFVHAQLTNSHFSLLDARGHCPNLSAPDQTTQAIKAYLAQARR